MENSNILQTILTSLASLSKDLDDMKVNLENNGGKMDEKAIADLKAELEKTKADLGKLTEDLTKSEADKTALTEKFDDLVKKLETAENTLTLTKQENEKNLVAVATEKTSEALKGFTSAPLNQDVVALVGLDEASASIAIKYAYTDLIKEFIALSKEVAEFRDSKQKEEALKLGEARWKELLDSGVAFKEDKAQAQKDKVSAMSSEAFVSYKTDLESLALSIASNPNDIIEKAKKRVGEDSTLVNANQPKKITYKDIK